MTEGTGERINDISIIEEMQDSFLTYAMSPKRGSGLLMPAPCLSRPPPPPLGAELTAPR